MVEAVTATLICLSTQPGSESTKRNMMVVADFLRLGSSWLKFGFMFKPFSDLLDK